MKEKAIYRLEEIICIYISGKSFASKLIKNTQKLIVKYKQANGKRVRWKGKGLEQTFSQRRQVYMWKTNKGKQDMKICGWQINVLPF